MRICIISDLHANIEALSALPRNYDELWVLGDLVNYGPDPAATIQPPPISFTSIDLLTRRSGIEPKRRVPARTPSSQAIRICSSPVRPESG